MKTIKPGKRRWVDPPDYFYTNHYTCGQCGAVFRNDRWDHLRPISENDAERWNCDGVIVSCPSCGNDMTIIWDTE